MSPTRAGILTVKDKAVMFDAPSEVCITFSSCKKWNAASRVMWGRLPDSANILFYEKENCGGQLISTGSKSSGSHDLTKHKGWEVVRSFILTEQGNYPINGIINKCLDESTGLSNSTSSPNVTILQGNTSANWLEDLPRN